MNAQREKRFRFVARRFVGSLRGSASVVLEGPFPEIWMTTPSRFVMAK
jgi:hypothetical protein